MEEKQITIDGETRFLSNPFLVIATQNPVETAGTFPLPEAQLDRFLLKIHMGFPPFEDEVAILNRFLLANPLEDIIPVCEKEELLTMQKSVKSVYVHPALMEYMIKIVEKTRNHNAISLGVSPRGSLALLRSSQAYAAIKGYNFVTPEIIQHIAPLCLGHRLVLKATPLKESATNELLKGILMEVAVPTEDFSRR